MRTIRLKYWLLLFFILTGASLAIPVFAQNANGISLPRDNAVVQGEVLIEGTATNPNFLRYELAFFKEFDPQGEWVVFATGDKPVVGGVLAIWDTTVGRDAGAPFYPDGTYRLRLRVVRQDSNYDEYYILGISVANESATPTPTSTPASLGSPSPIPTSAVALPTELPTLTPFPSATPRATPTPGPGAPAVDDQEPTGRGSILNLEGEFKTDQIKSGILTGVMIALTFFTLLGFYVLARNVLRFAFRRRQGFDILQRLRDWLSR